MKTHCPWVISSVAGLLSLGINTYAWEGDYCPSATPAITNITIHGAQIMVYATAEITSGSYDGHPFTFPYTYWSWQVDKIAANPSSGIGPIARYENKDGNVGLITFTLVCRSRVWPHCNLSCEISTNVIVDVEQDEYVFCGRDAWASLEVTDGSYSDSGYKWSSYPKGISGEGAQLSFSPASLAPGAYHVTVQSMGLPECYDTCDVHIVKATIVPAQITACHSEKVAYISVGGDSYSPYGYEWHNPFIGATEAGETLGFVPKEIPPGVYSVSVNPMGVDACGGACLVTILGVDAVGHEPGCMSTPGPAVSEAAEDEARHLKVQLNDDNDDEAGGGHWDNDDKIIDENDDDIISIELQPVLPAQPAGVMSLAIDPPENVQVFVADGSRLLKDYSVDLAHPSGDLAELASGPVCLRMEGLKTCKDGAIRLTYKGPAGGCSDAVHFQVLQSDLDIDSGNESEFNATGWDDDEDRMEDDDTLPGKYIGVNDGDMDRDGIPNFADGYDLYGESGSEGGSFTPIALELKEPIDLDTAKVKFIYSCSDPKDVTLTPAPTPADSDKYVPAPGHLRIWKRDGLENRKMAEVNADGDFIKSGEQYDAEDLGFESGRSVILYVEGIAPSDEMGDQRIQVEVTPDPDKTLVCRDAVRCTLLKAELVPDWNHDRTIDDKDFNHVTFKNPYRYWINNDDDRGDVAVGNSDCPITGFFADSSRDYYDAGVDGRCDLPDFFPIWLNLNQVLRMLPPDGNTVRYVIKQQNSGVNAVYTDLVRGQSGNYLTNDGSIYGLSLSQNSYEADTFNISHSGIILAENFLEKVESNKEKGVLLLEGAITTTNSLVVEVWKSDRKIYQQEMPLSISEVQDMYRWVNIRHNTGDGESDSTNTNMPPNYPDDECNGKQVVYVPGFSNTELNNRAGAAEVFKRMYWSGSRAMFTAVDWEGNEDPAGPFLPCSAFYHLDVQNAFSNAPYFADNARALPGEKYIIAHSLGNMMVSSAIRDNTLSIEKYFMLDAAVAAEAYRADDLHPEEMCPAIWAGYINRLWASEWHLLFEQSDNRRELTWRNRFGNIPNAVNYYSSGEDVLNNGTNDLPFHLIPAREGAWVAQELMKGEVQGDLLPFLSCHGGWGFNSSYNVVKPEEGQLGTERMLPDQAASLSTNDLRTNSFFRPFYDYQLYTTNGSQLAAIPRVRAKLLAEAIPALSRATGKNMVEETFSNNNVDMAKSMRNGILWPESRLLDSDLKDRWLHSDFKETAYLYVYNLYDDIVHKGSLQ